MTEQYIVREESLGKVVESNPHLVCMQWQCRRDTQARACSRAPGPSKPRLVLAIGEHQAGRLSDIVLPLGPS